MDQKYSIRRMEEKDLQQVAGIEKEIFSMPWTEEDFKKALNDSHNIYIVVDNGGEITGYCGLWSVLEEGQITNVAIRKDCRGFGVGTSMMEELIRTGMENGLTAFTLEVREGNGSARRLYEKLGFEEAGIRPNFYEKPKENAVIMWKYV